MQFFQNFFFKITRNYMLALTLIATIFRSFFQIVNFNFKLNVQINLGVFLMSTFDVNIFSVSELFPRINFLTSAKRAKGKKACCALLTFGGSGRNVNFPCNHLSDSLRGSLLPKESIHPRNRTRARS